MTTFPEGGKREENRADVDTAAAADWLIAHDRGLTAEEKRAFEHWISQPRHAEAWAEAQGAWARLGRIAELAPQVAQERRRRRGWPLALGAAAAVLLVGILFRPRPPGETPPSATQIVRQGPRQQWLSDGTRVELNTDTEVTEHFTAAERRVRLERGEAHFSVTKNAARPFVVDAQGLAVRAVGTAFNVRLDTTRIEVLVTEGQVSVDHHPGASAPKPPVEEKSGSTTYSPTHDAPPPPPLISAGEKAVVHLAAGRPSVEVTAVPPDEMSRALAWHAVQLRFHDLPLALVASEFNRLNRTQLVVDPGAADTLVAGSFRAENVELFVRFLAEAFSIEAERRDDATIVLRKAR